MEPSKTRIAKVIKGKNNKTGGIILPDVQQYYKTTVIKTEYIVLAQKLTHGLMKRNREPKHKPTHLLSINL